MMLRPLSLIIAGLLLAPSAALAHEHQTFRIGTTEYAFTVGSLSEPVAVDDKTGVDLTIEKIVPHAADVAHEDGDEHAAGVPAEGLEKTLKVELIAGDQKKTIDLTTQYGKPGSYKAVFIPTVQTTYTYRVFGTIEGKAVDFSFTCNPAGHPASPEDKTEVTISDGVTRIAKAGAFGCPAGKEALGFPEAAPTLNSLGGSGNDSVSLGLSAVALALAAGAMARSRRKV